MTTLARLPATTEVLDTTRDAIAGGHVHDAMGQSPPLAARAAAHLPPADWALVGEQVSRHPLHGLLLESPFTRRAFEKPRGYAGDAVLMDLIYGKAHPGDDLSPLGGMLYGYEFDSPCFQSVRTRRAFLAREIDSVAAVRPHPRALGRERAPARDRMEPAARAGAVEITAIDQDRDSLACIEQRLRRYRVSTLPATIGDLLRRTVRFENHGSRLRGGPLRLPRRRPRPHAHDGPLPDARPGRTAAHRQFHAATPTTPPSWNRSWTGV